MDLIGTLAGQLGLPPEQAQALAGTVLGAVKGRLPAQEAASLETAVPELGGWEQKAGALLGGAGAAEGLGALGGLLGGAARQAGAAGLGGLLGQAAGAAQTAGDAAVVIQALQRLGLDAGKASLVAPTVLEFLKSRLDDGLYRKVMSVAPALLGGGPGTAGGGGLGGVLGGLLG